VEIGSNIIIPELYHIIFRTFPYTERELYRNFRKNVSDTLI
jgi:hypothetical protein